MRSFKSLVKDLIDRFKGVLRTPPPALDFQAIAYLCLDIPLNEKMPLLKQIAKDFKLESGVVNKGIANLEKMNILVKNREKKPIQYVTLQEANWRKKQIGLVEGQFEGYKKATSIFLSNFEETRTGDKLNDVEMDLMIIVYMVHSTFVKAHTQYELAINAGDREAAQQAYNFMKLSKEWFAEVNIINNSINDYEKIKEIVTIPKLIYFGTIKK